MKCKCGHGRKHHYGYGVLTRCFYVRCFCDNFIAEPTEEKKP